MKSHLRPLFTAMIVLSIGSLACSLFSGGSNAGATPTEESIAVEATLESGGEIPTTSPPTATLAPSDPPEPTAEISAGSEVVDLDDPNLYAEPSDINTYYTSMEYTFQATGPGGSPVMGTVYVEGAHQVDPLETSLTFRTEGEAVLGGEETFTFVELGGTNYIYTPITGCISSPTPEEDDPFATLLDTGRILTGPAQRVLPDEVVNGVDSYVYAITAKNLDPNDPDFADIVQIEEGFIYISKEGGFVTRLQFNGIGVDEGLSSDPNLEGSIDYQLDFYGFNTPVEITIPDECDFSTGEVDYPVLPDATGIESFAGFVTYMTATPFDDVVEFYKAEMGDAGYNLDSEFIASPDALLTFSDSDGNVVLVSVTLDPETDLLMISIF